MSDRTLGIIATVFSVVFIAATIAGVWHRAPEIVAYFTEDRV